MRRLEVVAATVDPPTNALQLDCGDRPQDTWQYSLTDPSLTIDHDLDWLPLSQLVEQLTSLRSLAWGCQEQIPPCVLQVLTLKQNCYLDMLSFSLRSLSRPPTELLALEAHELALATSPLLRSLCLRSAGNYNWEAIMEMAAGGAPNLQSAALLYESSGSERANLQYIGMRRQPWRHDIIPRQSGTTRGKLTSLELCARDTPEVLKEWSTKTDFSALHTLKIHWGMDATIFRWLTVACRWKKLKTLVITPEEDNNSTLEDLYAATQAFLRCIPPLRSLKLTEDYDEATLQVALQCHGPTLRQLLLTGKSKAWLVSIDIIELIHQHCPVLEELYIPVARYAGGHPEVAVYRALGRLPAVKRLYLTFHQTNVNLPLDSSYHECSDPTDLDVRAALINFAVDEKLAKLIFETISFSKQPGLPLLEYLELRAEDVHTPDRRGYELSTVFEYLRRSWTCKRSPRDDFPVHECLAQESDPEEVLDREAEEQAGKYDFDLSSRYEPIFRSIWPGDGRWKDEWYSLPLTQDVTA